MSSLDRWHGSKQFTFFGEVIGHNSVSIYSAIYNRAVKYLQLTYQNSQLHSFAPAL